MVTLTRSKLVAGEAHRQLADLGLEPLVRGLRLLLPPLVLGVVALQDGAAQPPPVVARRGVAAEPPLALGDVAERAQALRRRLQRVPEGDDGALAVPVLTQLATLREERLRVRVGRPGARGSERRQEQERERGRSTGFPHRNSIFFLEAEGARPSVEAASAAQVPR